MGFDLGQFLLGGPPLATSSVAAPALTDTSTQTVTEAGGAWFTLPTLSQNGVLTLSTTGAKAGDVVQVTRTDSSAHTYSVVNGGPGANTLVVMPVSKINHMSAEFDGTNWLFKTCGTQ